MCVINECIAHNMFVCMLIVQVSAISTAKWSGVRLRDVLLDVDPTLASSSTTPYKHVHFVGADGMEASVPLKKVMDEDGDVLLATKMNDETLPRQVHSFVEQCIYPSLHVVFAFIIRCIVALCWCVQHGFPVRAVIPGHAGVRNVKWLTGIRLSTEEAYGTHNSNNACISTRADVV